MSTSGTGIVALYKNAENTQVAVPAQQCHYIEINVDANSGTRNDAYADYAYYAILKVNNDPIYNGSSTDCTSTNPSVTGFESQKAGGSGNYWGYGGTTSRTFYVENTFNQITVITVDTCGSGYTGASAHFTVLCF